MSIYTVTYFGGNYGSCLQAYALQTCLKKLGCNVFVLSECKRKGKYSKLHGIWKILKPEKHYSLFQRIRRRTQAKDFQEKREKLRRFSDHYLSVKTITDRDSFIRSLTAEDVFLAGSDQIWSTLNSHLSEWYSLQWVANDHTKYSYAASIGISSLTDSLKKEYAEGLSSFKTISLREKQAVDALSPLFPNKIRQDLDPTLLLDSSFWRKLESPKLHPSPYVFVYMLRPDEKVIQIARKIAKERNCNIIFTGQFADKFKGIKTVCDAGVEEFLSYIDNSEAIVTNSFHGTVFSILFEKPFLSVKVSSTESRAESLLDMLGLSAQLIDEPLDNYSLQIDYTTAKSILGKEREKSLSYLRDICKTV